MLEEHENQETSLQDLIDLVERDDLPTNEFTIQDKDPMVILGKLNEVISYLQTLQATINASDSKANEALQKAIQAVADATQALSATNGIDDKATQALANAIEAVSTANTALTASNTALSTANTAISTANIAETKAQEALDQVVTGLGTKVYRDTQLLASLDIKPIEDDIADNTTAITALQNGKVDKVTGKQLSTEDFTTAEKTKLAGLNNYDDTQVQADLSSLNSNKADKNNANQSITAGSVTAPTGNFSNINETLQNDFVKQGLADINNCSTYDELYTALANSPNGTGVGSIGYASQASIRTLLPPIPFPANFVNVYAKIIAGNDNNAWVIELSTIDLYSNGQTIPTYKLQIGKNIVNNTATYRVSKWYNPAGKYEVQKGIVTWSAARSHTQPILFPDAFDTAPTIVCTAIGVDASHASNICGLTEVTNAGFNVAVYGFGKNDKSIGVHWIAIGG